MVSSISSGNDYGCELKLFLPVRIKDLSYIEPHGIGEVDGITTMAI